MLDDRDVLLANASHEVEVGASAYHDALDALVGAHATLSRAMATRGWLTRFPEVAEPRPTLLVVPDLIARNGDPEKVPTVLAALRNLGDLAAASRETPDADEDDVDASAYWRENGPQKV